MGNLKKTGSDVETFGKELGDLVKKLGLAAAVIVIAGTVIKTIAK